VANVNNDVRQDVELRARQVAQLYSQTPQLLSANVVLTALAAVVLGDASGGLSYAWFAAVVVVSLARTLLYLRFRRPQAGGGDAAEWGQLFT